MFVAKLQSVRFPDEIAKQIQRTSDDSEVDPAKMSFSGVVVEVLRRGLTDFEREQKEARKRRKHARPKARAA